MLRCEKWLGFEPKPGCAWANTMVLNPAIIADPSNPDILHMLFRATGPWDQSRLINNPIPYPIFIGYAKSGDFGRTWTPDFSRPALAPALSSSKEGLFSAINHGHKGVNYANGCIEDPRLFVFEGELYLSVACRAFPPGPYWDHDDPTQCMPGWGLGINNGLGTAVRQNATVTLLYKVNLEKLKACDYEDSFSLVGPLHEPDRSDDRDCFLFPRRLKIDGEEKIVCIHRPKHPWNYTEGCLLKTPSIFLAAANSLAELATPKVIRKVLAEPIFPWEANRIGGSWPPVEISPGEWLFPYHGKQDDIVGYTQSFMILKERETGFPEIIHRPSSRLLYASERWELEGEFKIPCLFSCSGIISSDSKRLLMGYGAADKRIGILEVDYQDTLSLVRSYDSHGSAIGGR